MMSLTDVAALAARKISEVAPRAKLSRWKPSSDGWMIRYVNFNSGHDMAAIEILVKGCQMEDFKFFQRFRKAPYGVKSVVRTHGGVAVRAVEQYEVTSDQFNRRIMVTGYR